MFSVLKLFSGLFCFVFVHSVSIPIAKYKQQLLDVHNEYRRMQKGSDMNELVWDDALSQQAANWIKRCQFEHEMKGKGENLAFDSNPNTDEALINSSMKSWYDEIKMYNYNYKRCSPSSCHYTQIVWAKTRKVGCAIEKCDWMYMGGRPIKDAWYLGCWYDPKGNDISEFPYQKGKECSQCLDKQGCSRGLCTGEGVEICEDKNTLCDYWLSIGECSRNKNFMEKTCRKACKICKGQDNGSNPAPKQGNRKDRISQRSPTRQHCIGKYMNNVQVTTKITQTITSRSTRRQRGVQLLGGPAAINNSNDSVLYEEQHLRDMRPICIRRQLWNVICLMNNSKKCGYLDLVRTTDTTKSTVTHNCSKKHYCDVCKDIVASSQCRRWKYDCKNNKRYMEPNCKKTCGYCS